MCTGLLRHSSVEGRILLHRLCVRIMKFDSRAAWAITFLSLVALTEATFQSPPRGATYAASMVVGPGSAIFYTGITYNAITHKPYCFLATSDVDPTDFLKFEIIGNAEATATGDSCRSIAVLGGQNIALVGTADPEGYFRFVQSSETAKGLPQLGFGMAVTADSLRPIKGTVLSSFSRVPYPQAVVGDLNDPEIMYVVSMTANQDTPTLNTEDEFPNLSRLYQHGTTFALTVQAFTLNEDHVHKLWIKYFPVDMEDSSDTLSSVHVGGMINKPGVGLVITGSTAGKGEAFGNAAGTDTDGFVTVLNPATGALYNSIGEGSGRATQRFGSDSFEIVANICDDPFDENAFYIVGATVGDMEGRIDQDIVLPPAGSLQAFIRKVNANSLEAEWTVQLPAYLDENTITSAEAFGCAVNNIGSVFVVGQVKNGAGMVERNTIHVSKGGIDIWIARIDTETAERKWIQQVGSEGDDHVAHRGGVVIDADGNAIVYGHTNGGIYRKRAVYAQHDLFVIRFDEENGNFARTLSGDVTSSTKKMVPKKDPMKQMPLQEQSLKANEAASIEMATTAIQATLKITPDQDSVDNPQGDVVALETSSSEWMNKDGMSAGGPAVIVLVSFAAAALAMVFVNRRRKVRRKKSASSFDGSTSDWYVGSDLSPITPSRFGVVRPRRSSSEMKKNFGGSTYRDESPEGSVDSESLRRNLF